MGAYAQISDLSTATLHESLSDPGLESMNFLNEAGSRYPGAISFASGRPFEGLFNTALIQDYIEAYSAYLRTEKGYSDAQVNQLLFQYGRTKGVIHELVAVQLSRDGNITVDPEAIVVTVGCQEAMFITLRALRADERDVLLAVSPVYAGAARLVDMPVWPVRGGPDGSTWVTCPPRSARPGR